MGFEPRYGNFGFFWTLKTFLIEEIFELMFENFSKSLFATAFNQQRVLLFMLSNYRQTELGYSKKSKIFPPQCCFALHFQIRIKKGHQSARPHNLFIKINKFYISYAVISIDLIWLRQQKNQIHVQLISKFKRIKRSQVQASRCPIMFSSKLCFHYIFIVFHYDFACPFFLSAVHFQMKISKPEMVKNDIILMGQHVSERTKKYTKID